MLHITDLSYTYPNGNIALSKINLHVSAGTLGLLAGANASGKSTLLALLAGLFEPQKGRIERATQSPVRIVMQDADVQILGSTVQEDLMLGHEEADKSKAYELAKHFMLDTYWEKPVHTLSWGMKRKLCLAGALLDTPELLLLDEPLSGLDYTGIQEMRKFLQQGKDSGMTIVLAAHDLEPLIDLADFVAVLTQGRLAFVAPPETALDLVEAQGIRPPCSWQRERKILPWDKD